MRLVVLLMFALPCQPSYIISLEGLLFNYPDVLHLLAPFDKFDSSLASLPMKVVLSRFAKFVLSLHRLLFDGIWLGSRGAMSSRSHGLNGLRFYNYSTRWKSYEHHRQDNVVTIWVEIIWNTRKVELPHWFHTYLVWVPHHSVSSLYMYAWVCMTSERGPFYGDPSFLSVYSWNLDSVPPFLPIIPRDT